MIKYTSVEKAQLLSEESHKKIARGLEKTANHKIEDMTDLDKEQLLREISDDGFDK